MQKVQIIEKQGKYDTEYETILWTLKARSKDKTRQNIMGINIDNGFIVCTDGHRLHMAEINKDIPDGYYNVKSATKKQIILELNEDETYPDYTRIFPKHEPTHKSYYNGDRSHFVSDIYRKFADEYWNFNLDYLLDSYMEDSEVEMEKREDTIYNNSRIPYPLCMHDKTHNRTVLIMPLKAH